MRRGGGDEYHHIAESRRSSITSMSGSLPSHKNSSLYKYRKWGCRK